MRNVFSILFSLCFFIVNSQTLKFIDNDSFPVENVSIDLIDANQKSIYTSNYLGEIYLDKSIFELIEVNRNEVTNEIMRIIIELLRIFHKVIIKIYINISK